MKNRPIYYKSLSADGMEVNGRTVSGYLAGFNSKDSDKDVTVRGTISVLTSDYAVAELNDVWGVYALAAASQPSS